MPIFILSGFEIAPHLRFAEFCSCEFEAALGLVVPPYSAAAAQRNPTAADRSVLGAIKRYFPCSLNL